jgi:regulator of sigma E protease
MLETLLSTILPFVVVLSIVVFFHEYGHFKVARRNGVKVDAFSIGFGPELFGFTDRHGTRWKFSLIPLGGYVKMFGDANAASQTDNSITLSEDEKKYTLSGKTPWQRIKVAAAGPIANFILALFIYAALFAFKGVPHSPATVGGLAEDGIAIRAGFKVNDEIIKINDSAPKDFFEAAQLIAKFSGQDVKFELKRQEKIVNISVKMYEETPDKKPIKRLGIQQPAPVYKETSLIASLKESIKLTSDIILSSLLGFGKMITGQVKGAEVGGILSIGDMAAQSTKYGLATALQFMAFISIQLGVINLLPVPVLDGGHIMLNTIEAIRRKPLSKKMEESIYTVGFILVMGLMIFATWNDLVRYKIIAKIVGLFS